MSKLYLGQIVIFTYPEYHPSAGEERAAVCARVAPDTIRVFSFPGDLKGIHPHHPDWDETLHGVTVEAPQYSDIGEPGMWHGIEAPTGKKK